MAVFYPTNRNPGWRRRRRRRQQQLWFFLRHVLGQSVVLVFFLCQVTQASETANDNNTEGLNSSVHYLYLNDDTNYDYNSTENNPPPPQPQEDLPCNPRNHHHQRLRHLHPYRDEYENTNCTAQEYNPKPSVIEVVIVIAFLWAVATCCITICFSLRTSLPPGENMYELDDNDNDGIDRSSEHDDATVASVDDEHQELEHQKEQLQQSTNASCTASRNDGLDGRI